MTSSLTTTPLGPKKTSMILNPALRSRREPGAPFMVTTPGLLGINRSMDSPPDSSFRTASIVQRSASTTARALRLSHTLGMSVRLASCPYRRVTFARGALPRSIARRHYSMTSVIQACSRGSAEHARSTSSVGAAGHERTQCGGTISNRTHHAYIARRLDYTQKGPEARRAARGDDDTGNQLRR